MRVKGVEKSNGQAAIRKNEALIRPGATYAGNSGQGPDRRRSGNGNPERETNRQSLFVT